MNRRLHQPRFMMLYAVRWLLAISWVWWLWWLSWKFGGARTCLRMLGPHASHSNWRDFPLIWPIWPIWHRKVSATKNVCLSTFLLLSYRLDDHDGQVRDSICFDLDERHTNTEITQHRPNKMTLSSPSSTKFSFRFYLHLNLVKWSAISKCVDRIIPNRHTSMRSLDKHLRLTWLSKFVCIYIQNWVSL